MVTGWPYQNNQFSVIADSFNMVAGRINFEKMAYEIYISKKAASSEQVAQQLAHQIRAFDGSDRLCYLLPITIEIVADLDNNDWGRRPRGLQQGAAAPPSFGQPVVDNKYRWHNLERWHLNNMATHGMQQHSAQARQLRIRNSLSPQAQRLLRRTHRRLL
jgi:hypothetical protein